MRKLQAFWARLLLLVVASFGLPFSLVTADEIDFAHDVVPILQQHCVKCHADQKAEGGFSINTRSSFIDGGAVPGNVSESRFMDLIRSADPDEQMPPKDLPRVSAEQQQLLQRWVKAELPWTSGYTFAKDAYQAPLRPRPVQLPEATGDRQHPIDRIIDRYLGDHELEIPAPVDDATFLRRASLDLTGLLPSTEAFQDFVANEHPEKRSRLVDALLSDRMAYAEHWLTFWNDWLRNDYAGTGFITGGRKQVSGWLYQSLIENKPYDQFARELIAPASDASRGFIDGIRWRGTVSAGQSNEIQFAQSVAQTFLGINMKCASCHDSFIDHWKLTDAYSLAAVYASKPLEIHRCDKPTGQTATAAWLFPELGQLDAAAPRDQRLKQLSQLMTDQQNGRFARTVVNRLWAQLMGRGIIHPLDAMHTRPWNEDLLEYLSHYLVQHDYDLKAVLRLIATSEAYASRSAYATDNAATESQYVYTGPHAKRMTAEQYMDALWMLTGQAPFKFDAPIVRGDFSKSDTSNINLQGKWIWAAADKNLKQGVVDHVVFRKSVELAGPVKSAIAVITCDNEFDLYIGPRRNMTGTEWTQLQSLSLQGLLKQGKNQIVVAARNIVPSPAGLYFEARVVLEDDTELVIASDETWEVTRSRMTGAREGRKGKIKGPFSPAQVQPKLSVYADTVDPQAKQILASGADASRMMVRASLLRSDFLMRSLGRPNRDQIVTSRPEGLTTLEAIDLSNHETLAKIIDGGADRWNNEFGDAPDALIESLFRSALTRAPSDEERRTLQQALGKQPTVDAVADVLWAVVVLPEFMMVR